MVQDAFQFPFSDDNQKRQLITDRIISKKACERVIKEKVNLLWLRILLLLHHLRKIIYHNRYTIYYCIKTMTMTQALIWRRGILVHQVSVWWRKVELLILKIRYPMNQMRWKDSHRTLSYPKSLKGLIADLPRVWVAIVKNLPGSNLHLKGQTMMLMLRQTHLKL